MEGVHLLDSAGSVQVVINHVDNLILQGQRNHSNTDIVIMCSSNTHGLEFYNGNTIAIYGITIAGCGQIYYSSLSFTNITSLYIHDVILHDSISSIYGGMAICCVTNTHITNSTYTNNTAGLIGSALYIVADAGTHNYIVITNSLFANNTVYGTGAGLYILTDTSTHNYITITNSTFINNMVYNVGGGLFILSNTKADNNIIITNSKFTNNTIGDNGGGLNIYSLSDTHNRLTFINSNFTNNTVGGSGGGLYIYAGTDTTNNITVTNSAFTYNNGNGLFLYTTTYNKVTLSQVTILNNSHSGILAVSHTKVIFTEGHSIIANNISPADGGGIYLGKDSYLTTSNGGHVSFINNTAHRYGGAIYSLDNDYIFLKFNNHVIYGDQCTMHDNISATFVNNSAARAGDVLYGGIFTFCHDTIIRDNFLQQILNCSNVPKIIRNAQSVHTLSPVSSDPQVVCPCINGTINCSIRLIDREIYPGQILNVYS